MFMLKKSVTFIKLYLFNSDAVNCDMSQRASNLLTQLASQHFFIKKITYETNFQTSLYFSQCLNQTC